MRLLLTAALLAVASPAVAETQIYVDGRLCGVLTGLAYAGKPLGALDCRADVVPRKVTDKDREPLPRSLEIAGQPVGFVCDLFDPNLYRLRSLSCDTLAARDVR
jgi:hypothetical protein